MLIVAATVSGVDPAAATPQERRVTESSSQKNKALPTIVGQSTQGSQDGHGNVSHAHAQYNKQLQHQQQGAKGNLPPIGGGTGGAQYNQQHVQMQHQQNDGATAAAHAAATNGEE